LDRAVAVELAAAVGVALAVGHRYLDLCGPDHARYRARRDRTAVLIPGPDPRPLERLAGLRLASRVVLFVEPPRRGDQRLRLFVWAEIQPRIGGGSRRTGGV